MIALIWGWNHCGKNQWKNRRWKNPGRNSGSILWGKPKRNPWGNDIFSIILGESLKESQKGTSEKHLNEARRKTLRNLGRNLRTNSRKSPWRQSLEKFLMISLKNTWDESMKELWEKSEKKAREKSLKEFVRDPCINRSKSHESNSSNVYLKESRKTPELNSRRNPGKNFWRIRLASLRFH